MQQVPTGALALGCYGASVGLNRENPFLVSTSCFVFQDLVLKSHFSFLTTSLLFSAALQESNSSEVIEISDDDEVVNNSTRPVPMPASLSVPNVLPSQKISPIVIEDSSSESEGGNEDMGSRMSLPPPPEPSSPVEVEVRPRSSSTNNMEETEVAEALDAASDENSRGDQRHSSSPPPSSMPQTPIVDDLLITAGDDSSVSQQNSRPMTRERIYYHRDALNSVDDDVNDTASHGVADDDGPETMNVDDKSAPVSPSPAAATFTPSSASHTRGSHSPHRTVSESALSQASSQKSSSVHPHRHRTDSSFTLSLFGHRPEMEDALKTPSPNKSIAQSRSPGHDDGSSEVPRMDANRSRDLLPSDLAEVK
jgi:hypothetical protein